MTNLDILKILESKEIEIIGKLDFKNELEKLEFLKKLEEILKFNIKLKYINRDLKEIIINIKLNETMLKKLKSINWDDYSDTFSKRNINERYFKIYNNFLNFICLELEIKKEQITLENIKLDNQKKKFGINTNTQEKHENLYEKKEKFDIETTVIERAKKREVEILFDYNEPSHKITVNDFTLYFNRRLQYFTNLLSSRISMDNVMRISQLKDLYNTNTLVNLIGLISEITETKNGHIMVTIEDKSGSIKCFINKEKTNMLNQVDNFCLDEGIGVIGKIGNGIIWTDEFVIPSPPNSSELKKTEEESYIAFLSDIHFGAKVFVEEAFQKFIEWIRGETNNEELNKIAKKTKHIIIAGDIIEGIGIYPNQGKDAKFHTTELQYHEAARWLSQIPKDKTIIIIPGNHDTDRLSEPQPKLPYHKAYAIYNMENTIMLSNPSIVRLFPNDPSGGLEFFIYHGGSFFYYANNIKKLREKDTIRKCPDEIVKFLLEKRHLAPSHGSTLYIPDNHIDPLVIKKMPDFFITGHTHKMGLSNYKGCTIISCACWVEMSDYQEKMGMKPDVGKCILVNTKTRKPKIISFYVEKHNR